MQLPNETPEQLLERWERIYMILVHEASQIRKESPGYQGYVWKEPLSPSEIHDRAHRGANLACGLAENAARLGAA